LFIILLPVLSLNAQDISEYIPTENIDNRTNENKRRNAPKRKNIRYITKNTGEGLLYGNPCMLEQTRKMRFEYAVQTPGLPGSLGPLKRQWENLRTRLNLIFFRTPFWKLILNRRVRNCRKKSGDLVG